VLKPERIEYSHVGRTVLINKDLSSGLWVEGEDPGVCPLRETEVFLETVKALEQQVRDHVGGGRVGLSPMCASWGSGWEREWCMASGGDAGGEKRM
jgi:hypothetical protein